MKCYIAGKISNMPESEYKRRFREGEAEVSALGYIPVNPVEIDHNHDKSWLSFMRLDITHLLCCDAVYALNNWHESNGAKIEVNLALSLGIKVVFQK